LFESLLNDPQYKEKAQETFESTETLHAFFLSQVKEWRNPDGTVVDAIKENPQMRHLVKKLGGIEHTEKVIADPNFLHFALKMLKELPPEKLNEYMTKAAEAEFESMDKK
jgi:hypothetical protein